MLAQETNRAPRVFLSYSSDDNVWVDLFTRQNWFGSHLGNVVIEDYQKQDNVDFGKLGPWVNERVANASVVVAFVSEAYTTSKWSQFEWHKALGEQRLKRLIFVPVMMHADAKQWWSNHKYSGKLQDLDKDYQYADFTKGGQKWPFNDTDGGLLDKISRLAHKIRDTLKLSVEARQKLEQIATRYAGGEPVLPPRDPDERPTSHTSQVVLLGHPTSVLPEDVAADEAELKAALLDRGLTVGAWPDGWADEAAGHGETGHGETAHGKTAVGEASATVFVRSLSGPEAGHHAANQGETGKEMAACGPVQSKVTLWLPPPRSDKRFTKAAEACPPGTFPTLRQDTPKDLADWLHRLVDPKDIPGADELVVQIEDVGSQEGAGSKNARQLADLLRANLCAVVNMEVRPSPKPWPFYGRQFRKQVAILPGNRSIVALHDLNISPITDNKEARKAIERKFAMMNDELEDAARSGSGRKLDLFKAILVVNNAHAMPFSSYPDDGKWKDWRLLTFVHDDNVNAGQRTPVPDLDSLAAFRTHLRAWA